MARRSSVFVVCGPLTISEQWQLWLLATSGIQVAGAARSGAAALSRLAQAQPTHALVGCTLLDMSGAAWITQTRQRGSDIAFVGANEGQATCAEAMREAGANAFVVAGPNGEGLAEA